MDAPNKLARTMQNERQHIHRKTTIFDLPESVFHHIFSFLLLREIAKLSVCCKAWRNLCYVTPYLTINFDEVNSNPATLLTVPKLANYTNFVERSFLLRKSPKLLRFSLKCTDRYAYDYRIESWILCAITSCKVRELHLMLPKWFVVPSQLFKTSELEILVLNMSFQFLRFPPSIQWTNLQYLSLLSVKLPDNPFLDWIQSCRFLKTLTLAACVGFTTLTVTSDSLTTFKIWHPMYSQLHVVMIVCVNLETLHLELLSSSPAQSSVTLITPNLKYFKWYGPIVHQFLAHPFSLIESAQVTVLSRQLSHNDQEAILGFGSGIFSCLRHVKSLCLCGLSMRILAVSMMHRISDSLCSIEYLNLGSHLDDEEAFLMKYILRRITNVKTLVINQDTSNYPMVPVSKVKHEEVEKFLNMEFDHQLKTVKMRLLHSGESNIDFMKYLLKNAKELESITLLFNLQLQPECNVAKEVGKELDALQDKRSFLKLLVAPI